MESDEKFWELFRDAMRKLAARCRRVRHAKKIRSPHNSTNNHGNHVGAQLNYQVQSVPLQQSLPASSHHHLPSLLDRAGLPFQQQQSLSMSFQDTFGGFQESPAHCSGSGVMEQPTEAHGSGSDQTDEGMDVETMAESSSSPSPQTPISSASRQSTPTPASPASNSAAAAVEAVMGQLKEEEVKQEIDH